MKQATFSFWWEDFHAPGWHMAFYNLPSGKVVTIDEARASGHRCDPPPTHKDWVRARRLGLGVMSQGNEKCDVSGGQQSDQTRQSGVCALGFDRLLAAYFQGDAERRWLEGERMYAPWER